MSIENNEGVSLENLKKIESIGLNEKTLEDTLNNKKLVKDLLAIYDEIGFEGLKKLHDLGLKDKSLLDTLKNNKMVMELIEIYDEIGFEGEVEKSVALLLRDIPTKLKGIGSNRNVVVRCIMNGSLKKTSV